MLWRIYRHQLQDGKIRLLILSHSLNAESCLLSQVRIRLLCAPLSAKVHHEEVKRAVLDGARGLVGDEVFSDQNARVRRACLTEVTENGGACFVGPVVEDAADLVDECACIM